MTSSATRYRLRAFGLEIESDLMLADAVAGTNQDVSRDGAGPSTCVRGLSTPAFDDLWTQESRRVWQAGPAEDEIAFTVDLTGSAYRFWLSGQGRVFTTLDGLSVGYELGVGDPDDRERFIMAQALPVAALMHGYEVLHASAVAREHGIAAFAGVSGIGKTTLASRLILLGAEFVCDDVLVIGQQGGDVIAHGGPRFMAVHEQDFASLAGDRSRLGRSRGSTDKLHLRPPTSRAAGRLSALYHLEVGERFEIAPLAHDELNRSLAAAFAPYVTIARRLGAHLAIAHALSSCVPQFRLLSPRSGVTEAMIDVLDSHLTANGIGC